MVVLVFAVAYPTLLITGHEGHILQSLPTLAALYAAAAVAVMGFLGLPTHLASYRESGSSAATRRPAFPDGP